MSKQCMSLIVVFAVMLQTLGCSSKTMIKASDPQAKIYVNGMYKGTGTAYHEDTKIVGATNFVKIEKEGCMPQNYNFSRDEKFSVGACIGGVFVLVPFLWIMGYDAEHGYDYQCQPVK